MGKASKKKRKDFENRETKQYTSEENKALSSFFTKYGFLIALFLITTTTLLIYSNIFSSPFHFDDTPNIVENYKLRDLSNFWPPSGARYIGFLSFALNYYFGGLNVFGYHLLNIIIHIINSLLVWWLVVLTFKTPAMRVYVGQGFSPALTPDRSIRGLKADLPYLSALTVSLIFVSHPVQTQAVTYIVQRFASLSTLFYLLSLALYIKARLPYQDTELRTQGTEEKQKVFSLESVFCYLLSVFSAILAMKTKEIGFTLPFVVILYEFMFFSPAYATTGKEAIVGQGFSPAKRIAYLVPFLLTLLIIPLSLIGTDKPVGDIIGELREAAQETEEIPRGVYLLTQFRVIVTYIRLLFLPINQNLDYDYPLSHSLFEPATFLSFIFLLSIFVFAIYLFMRSRRTDNLHGLLISFGILWFFITLSVESSIIPIRDVIFEHRLYLPSVGAVIAFSSAFLYGISYAKERLDIKVSLLLGTCILLLATAFPLGIAAYKRNFVWKDEITLWEDVVGKSPSKGRGYNNLGVSYYNQGQLDYAVVKYKKALRLKPENSEAHNNLGLAYNDQGRLDEAIVEYKEALRLRPDYPEAYNNLGLAYHNWRQLDVAIEWYKKAIKLKPEFAKAHYNLGLLYDDQGHLDEAVEEYITAIRLKSDYIEAYYNLGNTYDKHGQLGEAIESYSKAIRLKPDHVEAHNNLGSVYYKQARIDEAIYEFKTVLRLKSDHAYAHFNLGLAYKEKGLKNEAIREFKEALKIKPDYTAARQALELYSR